MAPGVTEEEDHGRAVDMGQAGATVSFPRFVLDLGAPVGGEKGQTVSWASC